MKKIFLVLLVLAIIACVEVEIDKTEEIEEVIDESNGLMEDTEDANLQFSLKGIKFKPPVRKPPVRKPPVKKPPVKKPPVKKPPVKKPPVKKPPVKKPPVKKPPVEKPPVKKPPVKKPPVKKPPVIDPKRIPNIKKIGIKINKLKAKLKNMKLPKIKIGPKTKNFLDNIFKGIGKGVEKLKDLGLWEPLIGMAKNYGLQKANELCTENIENDEICQAVSDALGNVVDKITGTGESE